MYICVSPSFVSGITEGISTKFNYVEGVESALKFVEKFINFIKSFQSLIEFQRNWDLRGLFETI
jgi:hypothetical protein